MPTSTTIHTARSALVSVLNARPQLAGKAFYAWQGPEWARDFHELLWVDNVPEWTQEIPNIKAGRKQRQESYTFELVIWVAKPEEDSTGAETTDQRAIELLDVVDDVLAEDVQAGGTDIHWLILGSRSHDLIPYLTGWACQIVLQIEGSARLT